MKLSVLDLVPIVEGGDAARALAESAIMAQDAEALGYHRYWVAEHHNMPGVASSATAVVIQHLAAATRTIRVGAGGIMLPNHAPLMVAEAFGTLATLFPGRIDLGLGRAPGTDGLTMRALRRGMQEADRFPQDVIELLGYLSDADGPVRAVPGQGTQVPVTILGSSTFGAELAAWLGLPFAFASHFAPAMLDQALAIYRETFRPSALGAAPYVTVAVGACAAPTEGEAKHLRTSQIRAFARLRTGTPGPLPLPGPLDDLDQTAVVGARQALSLSAVGDPAQVAARLAEIAERTKADELIVAGMIHDLPARRRSQEIVARAAEGVAVAA